MYLTKRTYVKNWDHMKPEEFYSVDVRKNGEETEIKKERVSEIIEEVGYWRKANAIHGWFVDNVQEGNDNCGDYSVSREKLEELLARVNEVLADHSRASDVLPTREGFFFGDTEYGDNYLNDLQETKKMLESVLAEGNKGEFHYQSSW